MDRRTMLAHHVHAIWASWMIYMFDKGTINDDGSFTLPTEYVNRWKRQLSLLYHELLPEEQASDLEQADRIIDIIKDTE